VLALQRKNLANAETPRHGVLGPGLRPAEAGSSRHTTAAGVDRWSAPQFPAGSDIRHRALRGNIPLAATVDSGASAWYDLKTFLAPRIPLLHQRREEYRHDTAGKNRMDYGVSLPASYASLGG
jgi:hypothetical protein